MQTETANPQERIAREMLTQRPLHLGVDGEGTAHYWDGYERALALVDGDQSARLPLDETPFRSLEAWCEHVRQERGWKSEPKIADDVLSEIVATSIKT